ncbi:MAG: hypothetical protein IKX54_02845 [Lachnospiraceae bacterium]|nr:hypothetical protein [Lachnospiraceae bacterium]
MGVVLEFLREAGWYIFYIFVAVVGVLAGRALRNRKNAKAEAEALAAQELTEEDEK